MWACFRSGEFSGRDRGGSVCSHSTHLDGNWSQDSWFIFYWQADWCSFCISEVWCSRQKMPPPSTWLYFLLRGERGSADVIKDLQIWREGTSLAVQWSRLPFSNSRGMGSIPSQGTKIQHTAWHGPPQKRERGAWSVQVGQSDHMPLKAENILWLPSGRETWQKGKPEEFQMGEGFNLPLLVLSGRGPCARAQGKQQGIGSYQLPE